MNRSVQESYDEIPYPSGPHALSHPGHIGAIGRLSGIEAAPLDRCRVLEIGGSDGGNLLPIAIDFPDSSFYCVDISPVQIEMGRYHAKNLGVENLHFVASDLASFQPDSDEKFDYVIAQGVYSWVCREVQDRLLDLIKKHLSTEGVGYVSYNTFPGWHLNMALRDMLLFHVRDISDAGERIATAVDFIQRIADNDDDHRNSIRDVARTLLATMKQFEDPATYMAHEYLSQSNLPEYFAEFAARTRLADLKVFGDAGQATRSTKRLAPSTREWIDRHASDFETEQQYLDYFQFGMFRHSLLCHNDVEIASALDPTRWESLFVSSSVVPVDERGESWKTKEGVLFSTTHVYALSILKTLSRLWPTSAPISEIASEANAPLDAVAKIICSLWESAVVEIRNGPHRCTGQLSDFPCASSISRYQVAGGYVTSQRHERLLMDDPLGCKIVSLADGSRKVQSIADKLGVSLATATDQLSKILRHALLIR